MKRGAWVTTGVLVLAGALAWRFEARADQPTQWALLVGIDRYERSDVSSLNFAVADVKSLATTPPRRITWPTVSTGWPST